MNICGPELLEIVMSVIVIAQGGDIVGKSVYPYIYNVVGVKGNGNAPLEAGS